MPEISSNLPFLDPCWHRAHFGEFTYKPGSSLGPRRQAGLQLVYVFSGCIDLKQDQRELHLEAGQALLLKIQSEEFFQFSREETTHHGWCDLFPAQGDAITLALEFGQASKIIHLSERMLQLHKEGLICTQQGNFATASHLVCALISEYLRLIDQPEINNTIPKSVTRAKIFLESHLDQAITMDDVARYAHISLPHLNRLFKLHTQLTPAAYFCNLKMNSATYHLSKSGLELGEIAQRVGFCNLSHFCQFFKRYKGVSPLQYRKQAWASPQ